MSLLELPSDLPVPIDDGAASHLRGMWIPSAPLLSTAGRWVDVAALGPDRTVIYCYPMTGDPNRPVPDGWDGIPGARGCTVESCAFRDHAAEIRELGASIFGLSAQSTEDQLEAAQRLGLPFELLSDADGRFRGALRLPTFVFDSRTLLKRLTLIVRNSVVETVFYPVFPPDRHAEEVARFLERHP